MYTKYIFLVILFMFTVFTASEELLIAFGFTMFFFSLISLFRNYMLADLNDKANQLYSVLFFLTELKKKVLFELMQLHLITLFRFAYASEIILDGLVNFWTIILEPIKEGFFRNHFYSVLNTRVSAFLSAEHEILSQYFSENIHFSLISLQQQLESIESENKERVVSGKKTRK